MTDWIGSGTAAAPTEAPATPAPSATETALQKARRKLALWEAAEDAIAEGQSYQIKTTTLTRAALGKVREMVQYYEGEVSRLTTGRRRGARVMRFIPYDV